jgi:hypothetical protein
MPNWCYQNLYVYGKTKSDIDNFVNKAKEFQTEEGHIDLNSFYPTPQELVDTPSAFYGDKEKQAEQERIQARNKEKYGYANWYDWNCENYGTKWGACRAELGEEFTTPTHHTVDIRFESAWSPADGLIAKISALYPNLVFVLEFTEESDAFAGCTIFVGGNVTHNADFEPDFDSLPDQEEIGEDAWYEKYDELRSSVLDKVDSLSNGYLADALRLIETA